MGCEATDDNQGLAARIPDLDLDRHALLLWLPGLWRGGSQSIGRCGRRGRDGGHVRGFKFASPLGKILIASAYGHGRTGAPCGMRRVGVADGFGVGVFLGLGV